MTNKTVDVVLIGGGIMSATLGTLLKQVQPDWSITLFERFGGLATESSNAWNNAGTGHSALCELNYMPEGKDGSLSSAKAVTINEQFQLSREWWASLVEDGVLGEPTSFINATPHMTFVQGEKNVDYLRRRYETLKQEPLFKEMEFTDDPEKIAEWAPLIIDRRKKGEAVAATRSIHGTDVDFGSVTRQLTNNLESQGVGVNMNTQVKKVKRQSDGTWRVFYRDHNTDISSTIDAKFVFVGAGGGALQLLQSSKIPEIKGFGGFPISGEFFRCDNPEVVSQHRAKVYGKAAVGAPPMSVPHLDARIVDGQESLLFGPYAGFTPKFLKKSSWFDLPGSIRMHNIWPMIRVGLSELSLVKYLLTELMASRNKRLEALREYLPAAKSEDWRLITAGQRVQVMKKDKKKGGVLQFGTEIVTGGEGTIAGLLGASPGASTAVYAMLDVMSKCFPEKFESEWKAKIVKQIPSYGKDINANADVAMQSLAATAKTLGLMNNEA
ncbi:malate:quinone oxidoreductase [Leucobacter sp. UCMA 4100]|uniref:malate:quinone oxidoreductase n=1 Tax=Leucobacter sp. UCMA 4100 TaxID=2810534 RepID=UPI0022EAA110|nr:malate:quinone oxidoreductase [Leucobacter sp. UCMA 4100]MDA3146249.1 malate:quinone oxidoreductase [Leucobacter sp. UCMA 4100]